MSTLTRFVVQWKSGGYSASSPSKHEGYIMEAVDAKDAKSKATMGGNIKRKGLSVRTVASFEHFNPCDLFPKWR
jgi:hypothetical protein